MAWKLKKATPDRNGAAAEPEAPSAAEQIIDYSSTLTAPPVGEGDDNPTVTSQFAPGTDFDSADFFNSRTEAADDAVDSFNSAKQAASPSKAPDQDEWSLDAFAPYQPPAPFDFNQPADSGKDAASTRLGDIDFDAEPESALGGADASATSLQSSPLQPLEFGVVDFDLATSSAPDHDFDASGDKTVSFAPAADLSADPDEDWQLGETGTLDSFEAAGLSGEPTLMSGMAVPAEEYPVSPSSAMPTPFPAFDEPSEALSALHSQAAPLPAQELAVPEAPTAAMGNVDKTLLYGEASDEPTVADSQPTPIRSQPQLVVKFGPFTARYPVTAEDLVIGRPDPNTGTAPGISLEYDDAVSRRHARVYGDGGQIFVEDLGSTNGTQLNDSPIPAHQPMPLKSGDKIRVGERTEIDFQQ